MHDLVNDFHIAVPTAFYDNEDLNTEATLQHVRNLYDQGVKSVLLCGTTGEQHSLSLSEKLQLLESIDSSRFLADDFEIIFGVASIRQKEALQLAEKVNASPKISGVLLGFPPYILPSQRKRGFMWKSSPKSSRSPSSSTTIRGARGSIWNWILLLN